mgnify:CR=1 FL=1
MSPQKMESIRSSQDNDKISASSSSGKIPLLEVDINITPTHTERIQIFNGDIIDGEDGIARQFCQKHGLGDSMEA